MKKLLIALLALIFLGGGGLFTFYLVESGGYAGIHHDGNIIIEDIHIHEIGIIDEGHIYIPYRVVLDYLYSEISVDLEAKRFYLQLPKDVVEFENPITNEFVMEEILTLNFNLLEVEKEFYIPLTFIQDLIGVEGKYHEETQLITIDLVNRDYISGIVVKRGGVHEEPRLISTRVATVLPEEEVTIIFEDGGYYFIRTAEGELGYTRKPNIQVTEVSTKSQQKKTIIKVREEWKPEGRIGLVWDYVYHNTRDRRMEERIEAVDILSPTWFDMISGDGTIKNKGNQVYVRDAHRKGYKVWGLVTNSFNPDLTSEFLASQEAQNHFIRQILIYSGLYNLDGINIDFENIYYKDKDSFTQFVRHLTDKLHQENLIVSIDVTIPSTSPNWSMVYDRRELGKIVDYVAVMTYDEHWAASPRSGSVASIGWVERGIQKTLELVPNEKVLLGLPFYTRLWQEEPQAGKIKVSSRAFGMNRIREILTENKAEIAWDEKSGQYFSQYEADGNTYKVWLEEERSLALKASLVGKYNLGGFAAWRKDFEKEEVWDVLHWIIKDNLTYEEVLIKLDK